MTLSSADLAGQAVNLIASGVGVTIFTPADHITIRLDERPERHWVISSRYVRIEAPSLKILPAPFPETPDAVLILEPEGLPASVRIPYRHIDRFEACHGTERPGHATIVRTFGGCLQ